MLFFYGCFPMIAFKRTNSTPKAVCKGTIFFSCAQVHIPYLCCITYKKLFFLKKARNRLQHSQKYRTFAARYIKNLLNI